MLFCFLLLLQSFNLLAIDGVYGGVMFPDGQTHAYMVCLTTPEGDEICKQFTDPTFTLEYKYNWARISISSQGYKTIIDTLIMSEQCLLSGVYHFGTFVFRVDSGSNSNNVLVCCNGNKEGCEPFRYTIKSRVVQEYCSLSNKYKMRGFQYAFIHIKNGKINLI